MTDRETHCRSVFLYYQRLKKVEEFVQTNFPQPITLEDSANIAGLETKYFSAYFRKKTGMHFHDWLAAYRVREAMALMRTRNYSITETAYRTGFRDLRTFERAFKRHGGMTPRQYKFAVQPRAGGTD